MKQFNLTQIKLLTHLADGLCHSGHELGLILNVSRTAIWKQIKQLVAMGLPIQCFPQRGYQLQEPIIFLNETLLKNALHPNVLQASPRIHLFASIDSTNRMLKELPYDPFHLDVCCAEMQTDGRGRFGRNWYSPFGENIYLSIRWHLDCDLSKLSGLSLVVSLAVIATLKHLGINEPIQVKWPNDILWHDKKLCGSLIEVIAESNSRLQVIIGIGLNVNSKTHQHPMIKQSWCSLCEISHQTYDRNVLIAQLITQLHAVLTPFLQHGFTAFMPQWQSVDYLQGRDITACQGVKTWHGKASGVNESGQLILVDSQGATHYLSSGDTSLRMPN